MHKNSVYAQVKYKSKISNNLSTVESLVLVVVILMLCC